MIDRQTWLWTDEVKEKVRAKKRLYNAFLCNKTADNWSAYREARGAAKRAVAIAKAAHYDEVNRRLETRDGERLIYRLARTRHRQSEDVEKFHGVTDDHGQLLMDTKKVMERWRDYFEKISTEESLHPPFPHAEPIVGRPILPISAEEVVLALRKMKPGKATGPDDVAAELWKSRHWNSANWLARFFNQIIAERKMPQIGSQARRFRSGRRRVVQRTVLLIDQFICFLTS
ncbi:unnamed protein product [Nippostrongylus brasiliensis]|uniref:Reverse transcriptase domain-containing protein n=1 Tax=Nippostrongylus brasiliensis TaxID=27835 RepID=A0A0N4YLB4_NIPBR|nr:unnamed protein product [Nippostrongylus brasiliensis]